MPDTTIRKKLMAVCRTLLKAYGAQHWWPAKTPFEVMVGAVLTQNTAWSNVEKAIANLKHVRLLTPNGLDRAPESRLAAFIRPSGYYNVKAKRLKNLVGSSGTAIPAASGRCFPATLTNSGRACFP